jgi:4-methyl-5(b-hydroxyethyl)-thiazole monophosphate biosynthesis
MPGSLNLDASPYTDKFINATLKNGGRLAAICAAPLILGRRGLLSGKEAICYPGFESELSGAKISERSVVTDGNITTAKGMGVALEFASELVRLVCGEEKAKELSKAIMEN